MKSYTKGFRNTALLIFLWISNSHSYKFFTCIYFQISIFVQISETKGRREFTTYYIVCGEIFNGSLLLKQLSKFIHSYLQCPRKSPSMILGGLGSKVVEST